MNTKLEFDRKALVQSVQVQGKITCMHAEGEYLYVGTNRSKLSLYRVKKVHDEVMGTNTVEATLEDQKTFPSQLKDNSIIGIQTDPIYGLVFVHFKDPQLGLWVYNLNLTEVVGRNIVENAGPANFIVIDKNFENHRFLVALNGKVLLYSYANTNFNKETPALTWKLARLREVKVEAGPIYAEFVGRYVVMILRPTDVVYTLLRLKEDSKSKVEKDNVMPRIFWPPLGKWKYVPKVMHLEDDIIYVRNSAEFYQPAFADGKEYIPKKTKDKSKIDVEFFPSEYNVPLNEEIKDAALCFPYVATIVGNSVQFCNVYGPPSGYASTERTSIDFTGGAVLLCGHPERIYTTTGNDVYALIPPTIGTQIAALTKDLIINVNAPEHLNDRTSIYRSAKVNMETKIEMRKHTGLYCLYRGQIRMAFRSFLKAREIAPEPSMKVDVRNILSCFHSNQSEARPVDYFRKDGKFVPLIVPGEFDIDESFKQFKPLDEAYAQRIMTNEIPLQLQDLSIHYPNVTGINIMSILIQKAVHGLTRFLEKVRKEEYTEEEKEERFAVEYALLSLYVRKIDSDPDAYYKIEEMVTDKKTQLVQKITKVSALLSQFGCIRHVGLLLSNAGFTMKALSTLKGHLQEDTFVKKHDGVDDVIKMLISLSGEELLTSGVEFISWVMIKDPSKAIQIFIAPRQRKPDFNAVLDLLKLYPQHIKTQYLEYIIKEEGVLEEKYHTEYAITLINNITKLFPKADSTALVSSASSELKVSRQLIETLSDPIVRLKAGEEPGLLGEFRKNLLDHLRGSNSYNTEVVLQSLATTQLYEEQVELFRKMKRHEEALTLLLFQLKDPAAAEAYCDNVFQEDLQNQKLERAKKAGIKKMETAVDDDYNPHLATLIGAWLKNDPNQDKEDITKAMIDLLNHRATDIDPVVVLQQLPDYLPSKSIETFLTTVIQHSYHKSKTNQVRNKVVETAQILAMMKHKRAIERKVVITQTTICQVCDQPIKDAVFAVFPDMSVVHYKCLIKKEGETERCKEIHPIKKTNFAKFPYDF